MLVPLQVEGSGEPCSFQDDTINVTVADSSLFVVVSLHPYMRYRALMYAVNSRGTSNTSEEFDFTTEESSECSIFECSVSWFGVCVYGVLIRLDCQGISV